MDHLKNQLHLQLLVLFQQGCNMLCILLLIQSAVGGVVAQGLPSHGPPTLEFIPPGVSAGPNTATCVKIFFVSFEFLGFCCLFDHFLSFDSVLIMWLFDYI